MSKERKKGTIQNKQRANKVSKYKTLIGGAGKDSSLGSTLISMRGKGSSNSEYLLAEVQKVLSEVSLSDVTHAFDAERCAPTGKRPVLTC